MPDHERLIGHFFTNVKPICTTISNTLSSIIRDPSSVAQMDTLTDAIRRLQRFLHEYWTQGTHRSVESRVAVMDKCFDYVSFPLLMVLEQDYQRFTAAHRQHSSPASASSSFRRSLPVRCVEETFLCLKELMTLVRPGMPSRDHMLKFLVLFQTLFTMHLEYDDMDRREREILGRGKRQSAEQSMLEADGELRAVSSRARMDTSGVWSQGSGVASHEELKLHLLQWFNLFLNRHVRMHHASSSIDTKLQHAQHEMNVLCEQSMRPVCALFVSKLLDVSRYEQSKELRHASLICLNDLFLTISDAEILSLFFPGTVSSLYRVITGDYKQGFRTIAAAILSFRTIAGFVCSDVHNDQYLEEEKQSSVLSIETLRSETQSVAESYRPTLEKVEKLLEGMKVHDSDRDSVEEETAETEKQPEISKNWLQQLRKNFNPLLSQLFKPAVFHVLHPIAQLEMLKLASTLLQSCFKTLHDCIPAIIEVVMMGAHSTAIKHHQDSIEEEGDLSSQPVVDQKDYAIHIIERFKSSLCDSNDTNSENLSTPLVQRFIGLVSTIPSICTTGTSQEKKVHFMLFCSYIDVLGDQLRPVLPSLLDRLSFALMVALEPNRNDMVKIVEQKSSSFSSLQASADDKPDSITTEEDELEAEKQRPIFLFHKKHLMHIEDGQTLQLMKETCGILGKHGDLSLLIDHFRGILNSPKSRKFHVQCVFIIQHMIIGVYGTSAGPSSEEKQSLQMHVDSLLDDFFSPKLWDMDEYIRGFNIARTFTDRQTDIARKPEIEAVFDHILLSTMMLECIASFSMLMRDDFQCLLIRALFHILEKLGDVHILVKDSALTALQMIAYYCGYETSDTNTVKDPMAVVTRLVALNADYIIDDLVYRMKYLNLYPRAPFIMRALLETTEQVNTGSNKTQENISIVGLIEDTQACIFSALDNFQFSSMANDLAVSERYLDCFFAILHSIVKVMVARQQHRNDMPSRRKEKSQSTAEQSLDDESEEDNVDVAQYFRDYHEQKMREQEMGDLSNDEESHHHDDVKMKEEEQKEMDLVMQIMDKCQHYLGMSGLLVQNHVIDVLHRAVDFFVRVDQNGEPISSNDNVLPVIHKIWSPLVQRMRLNRDRETGGNHSSMTIMRIKFLQLIEKLVISFPEFMYTKMVHELWPVIRDTILPAIDLLEYVVLWEKHRHTTQSVIIERSQHIFDYVSTEPNFKLKLALLQLFERITRANASNSFTRLIPVAHDSLQTYDICKSCFAFLDARQPRQLQDMAMALFDNLRMLDPDSLWYALVEMSLLPSDGETSQEEQSDNVHYYLHHTLATPPHPDLAPIELPLCSAASSPLLQQLIQSHTTSFSGRANIRYGKYKRHSPARLPVKGLQLRESISKLFERINSTSG